MANKNFNIDILESDVMINYDVKRCKKCILSSNYPKISFGDDGICNYCNSDEGKTSNQKEKDKSLSYALQLIQSRKNRTYDCLVLFSGGKDSSYSLYHIKSVLKLKPLALTIDNGFVSNAVFPNMKAILKNLDIDHIIFKPSTNFMSALYKEAIEGVETDPSKIMYATSGCGSCISMVLSIGAKECLQRNIPILMGGWSPGQLTEMSLLPGSFIEKICTQHFTGLELRRPDLRNEIKNYYSKDSFFPALYNPLYGIDYNENKIVETLSSLGWERPKDTDSCSSNCRLNSYLIIDHVKKYGFHPYEYELAFHVRNGMSTREEALSKITNISVKSNIIDAISKELNINKK